MDDAFMWQSYFVYNSYKILNGMVEYYPPHDYIHKIRVSYFCVLSDYVND
jgi:hypothetical protein